MAVPANIQGSDVVAEERFSGVSVALSARTQGFEVCLIEPGQASRCGARPKTDVLDAPWLQRLHSHGLLQRSFRPPDVVIALRAYLRHRQMLISSASTHIQHMQKALEQMNVKLTEVVSDITGLTGMRIITAILEGQRDPAVLAALRDQRCKNDEATIARALEGTWRDEYLFELSQAYELYRTHQTKVTECDRRIEQAVLGLPDQSAGATPERKVRTRGRKPNDLRFDGTNPVFRALGVNLTAIEGIEVPTALVILGEIGVDVSKFPTEKHFASWLGLCPNHQKFTSARVWNSTRRRCRSGSNVRSERKPVLWATIWFPSSHSRQPCRRIRMRGPAVRCRDGLPTVDNAAAARSGPRPGAGELSHRRPLQCHTSGPRPSAGAGEFMGNSVE